MLASVSLRLSSERGVAVSSVLGTTHFVRVRRRPQAKKERRQGGAAALPLTTDTARGIELVGTLPKGSKIGSRRCRRRLR
jgi:hypothetical protein